MPVCGVDVSHHQDPARCDWRTAYDAGLRFVYVKGSEGDAFGDAPYVDPAAGEHIRRIRETPLLVGMYHFARPDTRFASCADGRINGENEGNFAADTAIALGLAWPGSLPVAIDLEKYTPEELFITDAQRDDFVRGMVDTLEQRLGRLPIIYVGSTFWGYQHTTALAQELHARGVPLWLVNYTPNPDPAAEIKGWHHGIWQWSGGGEFCHCEPWPGLPHPVDQNTYRGSFAELRGLAAGPS